MPALLAALVALASHLRALAGVELAVLVLVELVELRGQPRRLGWSPAAGALVAVCANAAADASAAATAMARSLKCFMSIPRVDRQLPGLTWKTPGRAGG
jgi:hypothetical protein